MRTTHCLQWDTEGFEITGLDSASIQRVLATPTKYPPETVRNVKFIQSLYDVTRGFRRAVPLSLFFTWPVDPRKIERVPQYIEYAITPLVKAVESGAPWFYPYLDKVGHLDYDAIPNPKDVG